MAIPQRIAGDVVEPHIPKISLRVSNVLWVTFSCRTAAVKDYLSLAPCSLGSIAGVYLGRNRILPFPKGQVEERVKTQKMQVETE